MQSEKDIKFINLVEEHPMLYDKQSGNYKRGDKKAKLWHEIALKMGFKDDDVAIKKWRYMRDKFVKVKREKDNKKSGAGLEDYEEWPLLSHLIFLDPYIQPRKTYSNIQKNTPNMELDNSTASSFFEEYLEEEDMNFEVVQDDSRQTSTTSYSRSRSESTDSAPPEKRLEKNKTEKVADAIANISSYFSKKSAENSDTVFLKYVAAEMEEMQKKDKNKLKAIITNFINEIHSREE